MSIADAEARRSALDPLRSFCVSAPAGSGKTELLIQRYLSLLARVARPEQVLAITFTRKAAAEMRERVVAALLAARDAEPCQGAHQETTRALALQALAANAAGDWQLLRDVTRLNIRTIDGFCAMLTRQMPVLSDFGGQARALDDAGALYAEAVVALFARLDQDHAIAPDLRALLAHFDNNWTRVQELLVAMLARRDQWREYVGVRHQPQESEAYLLATVRSAVTQELQQLAQQLAPFTTRLVALQRYAAQYQDAIPMPPGQLPGTQPEDLNDWLQLRDLLLTAGGSWRKRLTVAEGFPTDGEQVKQRKAQLLELIAQLHDIDGLEDALVALGSLPHMTTHDDAWQLVLQLSHILPHLAAELLLVFARYGQVDHCQVALSALQALGEDDAPTELALRLDYQLEHILVDEFQDTAINQFELVRRLTRGWGEHNDGNPQAPRTIMIVGDAMQSIYGFRDANVGLFLRARSEGFNGVQPEQLQLLCNFRSDQGIVDWVNETFTRAFPQQDNIGQGRVRFTPAVAVKAPELTPAVLLHGFQGDGAREQEVDFVCAQVALTLAESDSQSIAILGRSRAQLQPILAGFKQRGIAYSAPDMDRLADSMAIVDLLTLCRALLNPADRVAWLALLRAPWCGLALADLHRVGSFGETPRHTPVFSTINDAVLLTQLSTDGRQRLQHLLGPLNRAVARRDRLALRVWLEQLWVELGGPATLAEAAQLNDAERFFQLLEEAGQEGVGLDLGWLQQRLQKLYANVEDGNARVQVMTLHKAKGLEFDRVFLPGLGRSTRGESRQVLLWDEHTGAQGERSFLLAADDHSADKEATLYNYLKRQRKLKAQLELTRLLYVGATRAAKQLVVTAAVQEDSKKPGQWRAPTTGTLLGCIWETFEQQMQVHQAHEILAPAVDQIPCLQRLAAAAMVPEETSEPEPVAAGKLQEGANIPPRSLNRLQRHTGTVVHLALEDLARRAELPATAVPADLERWQWHLQRLGLSGTALAQALAAVEQSVNKALQDETGRWLLSSRHQQSACELALTWVEGQRIVDIVVDRTFVSDGVRWVVDYKNSQPEAAESLDAFLSREISSYAGQLQRYRDALAQLGTEPLQCVLYFPAIAHLQRLPAD